MVIYEFPIEHRYLVCIPVTRHLYVAFHARHLLFVASDAIILHNFYPGLEDPDNLRFIPKCEDRGMPQTVFCLEVILVDKVIVWHMTVVAVGHVPMGTVAPGCILGSHDVAVHTGGRIVGQVRISPGGPEDEQSHAHDHPDQDNHRDLPLWRR
jgi:hypothetical protein